LGGVTGATRRKGSAQWALPWRTRCVCPALNGPGLTTFFRFGRRRLHTQWRDRTNRTGSRRRSSGRNDRVAQTSDSPPGAICRDSGRGPRKQSVPAASGGRQGHDVRFHAADEIVTKGEEVAEG